MGKAAAAFYKELRDAGLPEEVAVRMTENYVSVFTSLSEVMKISGKEKIEGAKIGKEISEEVSRKVKEKLAEKLGKEVNEEVSKEIEKELAKRRKEECKEEEEDEED